MTSHPHQASRDEVMLKALVRALLDELEEREPTELVRLAMLGDRRDRPEEERRRVETELRQFALQSVAAREA
jgi:hypothetical protein